MLSELKFVQGAVAKKEYEPALTHFRIKDGRILGYNGIIALSAPIGIEVTATPKAIPFYRAIERCTAQQTSISVTPAGKIAIRSGKFRAYVDQINDQEAEILDTIAPRGEYAELPGEIVKAFRILEPYMGKDASRSWSNGIYLKGQSAFVTNNIIIVEYWLGQDVPEMNIPAHAVKEVIRVGTAPLGIQLCTENVSFHYAGDRWMRATLLNLEWPDVQMILDRCHDGADLQELPIAFYENVELLRPFVSDEGYVFMRGEYLSTAAIEDAGAQIELPDLPTHGAYHFTHLTSIRDIVDKIDFDRHPQPCPFTGPRMRGVILGMRDD